MPPTPIRRGPQPPAPAAPTVNFGEDSFYSAGASLPEGDYCLYFDMQVYTPTNRTTGAPAGPSRLGVMLTAYDLHNPAEEPRTKHLSFGTNAHLSFMPDATGKGLVAVPGGPGGTMPSSSNWNYFRKSLKDCGLPENLLTNDLSVIDGIWVHMRNEPEPEERKEFRAKKQAQTGEAAMQQTEEFKGPSTIPVVTEILEGGKPWEGTGGIDPAAPSPIAATPAKAPASAKPGPRPVAPTAAPARPAPTRPAAVAAPATAAVAADLGEAALNAIAAVLGSNAEGMPKLKLRTETFKQFGTDNETANAVINTYFKTDDKLNEILNQLGYAATGAVVSPQS